LPVSLFHDNDVSSSPVHCIVLSVDLSADTHSDEVFMKIVLSPIDDEVLEPPVLQEVLEDNGRCCLLCQSID
jgi:hypothetical protein